MSDRYSDVLQSGPASRSGQLDQVLAALLAQAPELQAAAVVSFDGLPMASALPPAMDEDRVAAMSAALLSLGERAAEGLGRGALSQVYVEGENGTVFLVSADDEAVLVAVGARGAKVGLLMFEVRRAAAAVATALRHEPPAVATPQPTTELQPEPQPEPLRPVAQPAPQPVPQYAQPAEPVVARHAAPAPPPAHYRPEPLRDGRTSGYPAGDNGSTNGSTTRAGEATSWT